MKSLFALVDCNNFYASCERIFNPRLEGKPVVVLSNNDGCVIARSDEAKRLGIKMGIPAFEIEDLLKNCRVAVFSTNYPLYGDISQRVMSVLSQFTPDIEIYSIDEAFLRLSSACFEDHFRYGETIARTVRKWTGIPVSVGIGLTKTLAKAANYIAKTSPGSGNVFSLTDQTELDDKLAFLPVDEVWGIGPQHSGFLKKYGIENAKDLKTINEKFIRNHFGVMGERTVLELRGIACYPVDVNPSDKKAICFSRSYGHPIVHYHDLEQATLVFATTVAKKLRRQNSLAQSLTLFVMTNRFARGPQYVNGYTRQLPVATNFTSEIIHHTIEMLQKLYRKGYKYKKSGVIANDLIPDNGLQCSLWDEKDRDKHRKVMDVIDTVNTKMGKETLRFAVQEGGRKWKMRQEKLSPQYTTKWEDLMTIDVDKEIHKQKK